MTAAEYESVMAPPSQEITPDQYFEYMAEVYRRNEIVCAGGLEQLRRIVRREKRSVLVVPKRPAQMKLPVLIGKLTFGGKQLYNQNDLHFLVDIVPTPEHHYVLAGVDDGRTPFFFTPGDPTSWSKQDRSPFTWWESYCLVLCFGNSIPHLWERMGLGNLYGAGSKAVRPPGEYMYVPCFANFSRKKEFHKPRFTTSTGGFVGGETLLGVPTCKGRVVE